MVATFEWATAVEKRMMKKRGLFEISGSILPADYAAQFYD